MCNTNIEGTTDNIYKKNMSFTCPNDRVDGSVHKA